ncbi:MAG: hypothetical protein ACE5HI_18515 [bacterium]
MSNKYNFIFFCNGRTGTTSLEMVLSKYHDNNKLLRQVWHDSEFVNNVPQRILKHCPPYIVKNILKERYQDYFSFVYARNPYDWLISQIFYNFHDAKEVFSMLDSKILSQAIQLLSKFRCFKEDETLFQYQYLIDKDGRRIVDYVGHFETFDEDWKAICTKIGIPYIKLLVVHKIKKKHYKEYYPNKQILNLVYNYYKKDFDYFGYEKEL